jgi:hypothetical protein
LIGIGAQPTNEIAMIRIKALIMYIHQYESHTQ